MDGELIDVWLLCSNGDGSVSGVFLIPVSVLRSNKVVKSILEDNADKNGDTIYLEFKKAGIDMHSFLKPFEIERNKKGIFNYDYKKYRIVRILQPEY